jgi:hypothetical protein
MHCKADLTASGTKNSEGTVVFYFVIRAIAVLLVSILAHSPSWATLGQSEASVTSDQLHMKSKERVQSFQNYKVHELTTGEGSTIREYVSPQGSVFAITWHGRFAPDMNQLLGTYINNFQTATPAQTKIQRRRGITIKTGDFVYTNICHLRLCAGSAYLPKVVPPDVAVEAIQ